MSKLSALHLTPKASRHYCAWMLLLIVITAILTAQSSFYWLVKSIVLSGLAGMAIHVLLRPRPNPHLISLHYERHLWRLDWQDGMKPYIDGRILMDFGIFMVLSFDKKTWVVLFRDQLNNQERRLLIVYVYRADYARKKANVDLSALMQRFKT